ncbi:hypothetical protein OQE_17690 [Escherichia coli J53]|nr:hypothetical protein OQE_17690 [Escherichia coli J53]
MYFTGTVELFDFPAIFAMMVALILVKISQVESVSGWMHLDVA